MRRLSPLLFLVLFIAGLILIYGSFCLFMGSSSRTPTAWLNLSVIYALYLIQFGRFGVLFTGVATFEKALAGIGISWFAYGNYVFWSLLIMIAGHFAGISFKVQLILQLTILLITMFWLAASLFSMEHVSRCEQASRGTLSQLEAIRRRYQRLTMAAAELQVDYSDQVKMLTQLQDDATYFSGIITGEAAKLDARILELQDELQQQIETRRSPDETDGTLRKLASMMKLRKSCRSS